MRLLERRGIPYTPAAYSPDIRAADEVARAIDVAPSQVFKTLVIVAEGSAMLLVMLPSDRELDLKQCAAAVGVKRVRMATRKEAEAKTGLLAGGISALATLGKPFAVYLDQEALRFDAIWISAGQRGFNLRVGVDNLLCLTRATVIDLGSRGSGSSSTIVGT